MSDFNTEGSDESGDAVTAAPPLLERLAMEGQRAINARVNTILPDRFPSFREISEGHDLRTLVPLQGIVGRLAYRLATYSTEPKKLPGQRYLLHNHASIEGTGLLMVHKRYVLDNLFVTGTQTKVFQDTPISLVNMTNGEDVYIRGVVPSETTTLTRGGVWRMVLAPFTRSQHRALASTFGRGDYAHICVYATPDDGDGNDMRPLHDTPRKERQPRDGKLILK